jgi:hypothetical protein
MEIAMLIVSLVLMIIHLYLMAMFYLWTSTLLAHQMPYMLVLIVLACLGVVAILDIMIRMLPFPLVLLWLTM